MTHIKEITSLTNPEIQHLVKLRSDTRYRNQVKKVLLEGYSTIKDLSKVLSPKKLIVTRLDFAHDIQGNFEILHINEKILHKITSVQSPEGILAEFDMPKESPLLGIQRLVVADKISDPGNLGTIIRTSTALGWDGIFLVDGTCDPFNDKSLRAAKGTTFMLPYRKGSWNDLKTILDTNGCTVVAADLEGKAPETFCNEKQIALILGNETHGISMPKNIPSKKVHISLTPQVESLNVATAAAILLYELRLPCQKK